MYKVNIDKKILDNAKLSVHRDRATKDILYIDILFKEYVYLVIPTIENVSATCRTIKIRISRTHTHIIIKSDPDGIDEVCVAIVKDDINIIDVKMEPGYNLKTHIGIVPGHTYINLPDMHDMIPLFGYVNR